MRANLSVKLIALFVGGGLLLASAIAALTEFGFERNFVNQIQPHLRYYIDQLADEIGSPPSIEKAKAITASRPIVVRIFNQEISWASDGTAVKPQRKHWHEGSDSDHFEKQKHRKRFDGRRVFHDNGTFFILKRQADTELFFGFKMRTGRLAWFPIIACLLVALGLYGFYRVTRWLFAPVRKIQEGVRLIGEGHVGHQIEVSRTDELGELAKRVNLMSTDLADMLKAKRDMLLALSHELKSPLARARVTLALLEPSALQEDLLRDQQSIERLIDEVLESERAHQDHALLHRSPTDIEALLKLILKEDLIGLQIAQTVIGKPMDTLSAEELKQLSSYVRKSKKRELVQLAQRMNSMFKNTSNIDERISYTHKKNKQIQDEIVGIVTNADYTSMIKEYYYFINYDSAKMEIYKTVKSDLKVIDSGRQEVRDYMSHVRTELETSVHGHSKAKRQIERIIGQWMNGDNDGYAFGFEGPPGVGKTSLAKKGIARCLKDNSGDSRPFALIAVGGASNGSVFEGHNYTYVGSTWGKICDILMETKCMNPIIFIDELDKISRTEHGKEIVGILTHLIDGTQNDKFQDKYFSGVELDLSKVLFVFSYNDVELVDRILLDRIHRVKFKSLTLEDKLIISRDFIIPEILGKMGMNNSLTFSDETITQLIDTYTNEAGVRKLKELLFEVISEINLLLLDGSTTIRVPTEVLFEDIKSIYLKEHHMRIKYTVHQTPSVGLINGLWANALGDGGVLAIEAKWFPTTTFLDLKLTGMQGDVMQESMNVAKTLAWDLTNAATATNWLKSFKKTNRQGLHIHCPDGATPKDGPSAGTAITVAIYSLINNRSIRNDVAITGEITLNGNVTAIGGLDNKLYGGLAAGVKEYIFPSENKKDFQEFIERMDGSDKLEGINFHEVSTIQEVFDIIFT